MLHEPARKCSSHAGMMAEPGAFRTGFASVALATLWTLRLGHDDAASKYHFP